MEESPTSKTPDPISLALQLAHDLGLSHAKKGMFDDAFSEFSGDQLFNLRAKCGGSPARPRRNLHYMHLA